MSPSRIKAVNGLEKVLGLRHKEVILTFDDGPVPGSTTRILDTLRQHCTRATFFSVGRMAAAYPQIARRIVREGHTLAHHTHSHSKLTSYGNADVQTRIDRGIAQVQKAAYGRSSTSARVPFFRYPYLARNARTDAVLRKKGLISFGTNIDSLDWKKVSPEKIISRVMGRLKSQGRGIILLHDIHARTASALPILLKRLKQGGYKVVHVVPSGSGSRTIEVASLDTKPVAPKAKKKAATSKSKKVAGTARNASQKTKRPAEKAKNPFKQAQERFKRAQKEFRKKWGLGRKTSALGMDYDLVTASIAAHDNSNRKQQPPKDWEVRKTVETDGFVEIAGSSSARSTVDRTTTSSVRRSTKQRAKKQSNGLICVSGCR